MPKQMNPQDVDHMFNFRFEKTAEEIKTKAESKIIGLEAKIEERAGRIAKMCEEHAIDDAAMVQLLKAARKQTQQSYRYTSMSNSPVGPKKMEERTVGAGVVNFLLTESDHVESEKDAVKKLRAIVANLRPLPRITASGAKHEENSFALSYSEMEYLGF